jgi:uncharacterized protein YaeQ
MARNATIHKVQIELSDLKRNYFDSLNLVLAQHPSEKPERLLARLLAYCMHSSPALEFTRGLSSTEEPELWAKTLDGRIDLWIELGQPDLARIKKASNQANKVVIYTYRSSASLWWQKMSEQISHLERVKVIAFNPGDIDAAAQLITRQTEMSIMIDETSLTIYCANKEYSVEYS